MRRFILIGICLCTFVILFSQQSFAATLIDMSPSVFANTFEQTGSWSIGATGNFFPTTNWPNPTFNSWLFTGTNPTGSATVNSGTLANLYSTVTDTGGIGTLDFYYNGTEYTVSGPGSSVFVFHSSYGTFIPSGSSMEIIGASYPLPIDFASNGKFTGFYFNSGEIQGTMNYLTGSLPSPTGFGGNITSGTASITGSAVPIPAAIWLFGSGLVGLVGIRRRFKG